MQILLSRYCIFYFVCTTELNLCLDTFKISGSEKSSLNSHSPSPNFSNFSLFQIINYHFIRMATRKLCIIKRRTECHYHHPLALVRLNLRVLRHSLPVLGIVYSILVRWIIVKILSLSSKHFIAFSWGIRYICVMNAWKFITETCLVKSFIWFQCLSAVKHCIKWGNVW